MQLELEHLLAIQANLEKDVFSHAGIPITIEVISLASNYGREACSSLKIVSDSGVLLPIQDINFHDVGAMKVKDQVSLTHSDIPRKFINRLQIIGLQQRLLNGLLQIDDVDDEEFEQQEDEYLANADDSSGAISLSWTLDDRSHTEIGLISPEMRHFQGPALLVHNDTEFTDEDFKGFKRVGKGSKRDDKTTIGQFRRGSQTMFHWTDVPFLLSG